MNEIFLYGEPYRNQFHCLKVACLNLTNSFQCFLELESRTFIPLSGGENGINKHNSLIKLKDKENDFLKHYNYGANQVNNLFLIVNLAAVILCHRNSRRDPTYNAGPLSRVTGETSEAQVGQAIT